MNQFQFKISYATFQDTDRITSLSDVVLGKGFLTRKMVKEHISNKNIIVSQFITQIVGFLVFEIFDRQSNNDVLLLKNQEILSAIKQEERFAGRISVIVVDSKFRNKGIGTQLFDKSLQILTKKTTFIYTIKWLTNIKGELAFFYERAFSQAAIIKEYWKEESIQRNYECAICGLPPCKCDAAIFTR